MWDVSNLNPGTKFPYPWDTDKKELEDPNCEWIEVTLLPDEEMLEISKLAGIKFNKSERTINPKTRRLEYVQLPPDIKDEERKKYNEELWDRTIKDWQLFGPGGKKVNCDRETKIKFMSKSPKFARWYNDSMERLELGMQTYKEEVEKN